MEGNTLMQQDIREVVLMLIRTGNDFSVVNQWLTEASEELRNASAFLQAQLESKFRP